jgi:hypothetical protein
MVPRLVSLAIALTGVVSLSTAQTVVYVDDSAAGANDGTSWADAFVHLQDALAVAQTGDEVWVASGVYRPDLGVGITAGDASVYFSIPSGVTAYGGFDGTEAILDQRAGLFDQTVLDGDLLGDDPIGLLADYSEYILRDLSPTDTTHLDGFRLRGATNSAIVIKGAGATLTNLLVEQNVEAAAFTARGNLTLQDCTFRDSGYTSGSSAAPLDLGIGATLFAQDCEFRNNQGRERGGAWHLRSDTTAVFVRCTFVGNEVTGSVPLGGAFYATQSSVELHNCRFLGNRAIGTLGGTGGGANLENSNLLAVQSIWSGNEAVIGGGLMMFNTSGVVSRTIEVTGCTASGNSATNPVGVGGLDLTPGASDTFSFTNCITWANTSGGLGGESAQVSVPTGMIDHSCVEGWTGALGGTGNIGLDPLFVDADGADDVVGTSDDDLQLGAGSGCRDAADSGALPADAVDLDGDGDVLEPLPIDFAGLPRQMDHPIVPDTGVGPGPALDMGAHEHQGALSRDVIEVSMLLGGTQTLTMEAGSSHAGELHLLLGSLSGTSPGIPADGHILPLSFSDPYFFHTLTTPNSPPLFNSFGTLGSLGEAVAQFVIPPGTSAGFAGVTVHHAFAAIEVMPGPKVTFTSDATACEFVP